MAHVRSSTSPCQHRQFLEATQGSLRRLLVAVTTSVVSFDISFVPVHKGEPKVAKNPFTNLDMVVRPRTMTRDELAAVAALLGERREQALDLGDGSSTEVFGDPLDDGFMLALRSWTPAQSELVFKLCREGNLIAMLDDISLCATDEALTAFRDADDEELMGELVKVVSATELHERVHGAFAAWQDYRDEALG